MRFKDITSITGLSGLFKMESQKPSGVIVTSLAEGWTKFISSREHLFSPLENISIYTSKDTVDLLDVLIKAYEQKDSYPPADPKSDNETLKAYFEKVLPDYDQEKVHMSDIKKFVKWFSILDEKGILKTEVEEKEKEEKLAAEEKEKMKEEVVDAEKESTTAKSEKKSAKKETKAVKPKKKKEKD